MRADSYWTTFPGRPRSDADPMLRLAKEKGVARPLPLVSTLAPADQMNLEARNVEQSLKYARETLNL